MPRFFFDTDDGHTVIRDEDGLELKDLETSQRLALKALTEIVGEYLPPGEHRTCTIDVRNAVGRIIYHAQAELTGHWLI